MKARMLDFINKFKRRLQYAVSFVEDKFDVLINSYLRLNPREQKFIMIGVPALLLTGIIIIFSLAINHLNQLESRHKRLQKELSRISQMKGEYETSRLKQEQLKRTMQSQSGNFSIFTFLENQAALQNISDNISSMKEKATTPNDLYKETAVDVQLQKVSLSQLLNYLFHIENSPHLIQVKNLRIRPRYDNAQYLNVDFQVSTFEVSG